MIIGHRGAPGYRPEHTLASYELAYRMGVSYVDVDLVPTKDGQLVARHEPEIGGTTDVAQHPEFANRKKTLVIDGVSTTGWFTQDFTLAELKTLRAVERIPANRPHNTLYNGRYQIATFQEVLDLTKRLGKELHRTLGTYPEVKHSTFFSSIGNPTEPKLVALLKRNGLDRPDAPAIIQSFEVSNLIDLHKQVRTPLLQLTSATGAPADFVAKGDKRTYADLVTPQGLREVAKYAKYLGPDKAQVIPRDKNDNLARRPRSSRTRTRRAFRSSRTRSGTKTRSCRRTCARRPSRTPTGTSSPRRPRSSRPASTASSPTSPTPPSSRCTRSWAGKSALP